MKNLDQIVDELMRRVLPGSLEEKKYYLNKIKSFRKRVSAMDALLLANIERTEFKGNAALTMNWATEESGYERATIQRYLRIGRLLLDVDEPVFDILKYLDSDKVIYILTLPKKDIPKFVLSRGKKLIKMTRQAVIDDIHEILGKESKAKSDKYQPDMFDAIDAFLEVDDSKLDNLYMDERFNGETVSKYYKSGMVLVENVVNYLNVRGGNPEVIATAENQLRDQADKLAEIRERMALKEVG